jgi:hypothetical protein
MIVLQLTAVRKTSRRERKDRPIRDVLTVGPEIRLAHVGFMVCILRLLPEEGRATTSDVLFVQVDTANWPCSLRAEKAALSPVTRHEPWNHEENNSRDLAAPITCRRPPDGRTLASTGPCVSEAL